MKLVKIYRGPKGGKRSELTDVVLSNKTLDGYVQGVRNDILDLDEGESITIKKEEI